MADTTKKDSTNELPMFDIEEALRLVITIHEKALETASMQEVAKGCGYANPTSTPFYRRLAAARLFKFLSSPKPELTRVALDYLKPETDDGKQNALTLAIMGIPAYADLVEKHIGKRLNVELVSNGLAKAFSITDTCATQCAKVLVSSLKFAKFISADGTVAIPTGAIGPVNRPVPVPEGKKSALKGVPDEFSEQEENSFYLDKDRTKKITLNCPLFLTQAEYDRICNWIKATWIVEEAPKQQ
jgi:hypothetical protein